MNVQDAVNDLLLRGLDDDIQASEVASVVMRVCGAATQDQVRELSLGLIREIVRQGLMEVGDIIGIGFHPSRRYASVRFQRWDLSFEEGMERVAREWRALGRNPSLGEICWLINTERGNEVARQLLDRGNPHP
jgi:hypothetical protein